MNWRGRSGATPRQAARLVVLFLVAMIPAASYDRTHAEEPTRSEWTSLAPGLWHRSWTLGRGPEVAAAAAHAFRVDPRVARVTVLDARTDDRRVATVSSLRKETGAYLVVNGSFFDEKNRPLGLVIGDGREQSPFRKVDQGIFLITGGKPRIQHTREPLPEGIEVAIQAFPRLVVNGRALRLKPQASRRSAVCVPGDGTVMIVVVPVAVSLADLARNLVLPPSDGGLGCWAALNLDGGPSTQLSLATAEMTLEVEGGWPVPNGLAVFPK